MSQTDSMKYGTTEKKKFLLFHRSCESMSLNSHNIFNNEVKEFLKKNSTSELNDSTIVPVHIQNEDYNLTFNFKYKELFPYNWENNYE